MGVPSCNCIPPDGDDWTAPWLRECEWHQRKRENLQIARGELADIANSTDINLRMARKKAARTYSETDDPPLGSY